MAAAEVRPCSSPSTLAMRSPRRVSTSDTLSCGAPPLLLTLLPVPSDLDMLLALTRKELLTNLLTARLALILVFAVLL